MSKALTRTVRLVSLAAIAMSVAACEPDDGAGNLSHFSLAEGEAPFDLGLEDAGLGGGIGDLLPAALPLLAGGGGDYGLAPSWDYARGDYVDYAPGDPYDYYGYEEPYGGAITTPAITTTWGITTSRPARATSCGWRWRR